MQNGSGESTEQARPPPVRSGTGDNDNTKHDNLEKYTSELGPSSGAVGPGAIFKK